MHFIHRIASTLEAGTIAARISEETNAAVERLFPEKLGAVSPPRGASTTFDTSAWLPIPAQSTGYIQSVDLEGLARLAASNGVAIRMHRRVGEFLVAGTALASACGRSSSELCRALNRLYAIDSYRSVHQDAEFGIRQMVDIALRALSPGVNDSTTAATCVDYIGAVLLRIADRRMQRERRNVEAESYVIERGATFADFLHTSLDEIRVSAAGNVRILSQMLGLLERVGASTPSASRRRTLRKHAERIVRGARVSGWIKEDRDLLLRAHESARRLLAPRHARRRALVAG